MCWTPLWNQSQQGVGLEHLLLSEHAADSVVLAFDDVHGPFRLAYRLTWNEAWQIRAADLDVTAERFFRSLRVRTEGLGHWQGDDGSVLAELDGCLDVDIWPTPFTNSFPLHRAQMSVGERRQFDVAWILAPDLTVQRQAQAYTRLTNRLYIFESLDGSGFRAELFVDKDGIVEEYPALFHRVPWQGRIPA